jgi:hypothetical protein
MVEPNRGEDALSRLDDVALVERAQGGDAAAYDELVQRLQKKCADINVPSLSIIGPVLQLFQAYLGAETSHRVGAQHVLNAEYFKVKGLLPNLSRRSGWNADCVLQDYL